MTTKTYNSPSGNYLTSLSPNDNSLWKATKRLRRPQVQIPPLRNADGSWAKSDDDKSSDLCGSPQTGVYPPPAPYYWRCNSHLSWRPVSNVPTYHTLLPKRSDKDDSACQRTQGTWIRPHHRESTQRATQEGYNSSHCPLQLYAPPLLLPTLVEIRTNYNGSKTWQTHQWRQLLSSY